MAGWYAPLANNCTAFRIFSGVRGASWVASTMPMASSIRPLSKKCWISDERGGEETRWMVLPCGWRDLSVGYVAMSSLGEGDVEGEESGDEMREKHIPVQLPVDGSGRGTVWRRDSVDARWIWTVGDECGDGRIE